jgi:hypothetical protein
MLIFVTSKVFSYVVQYVQKYTPGQMDVVVLNEESNMPDREKLFLSGKNHYATY